MKILALDLGKYKTVARVTMKRRLDSISLQGC
jgi:hypothetical protein